MRKPWNKGKNYSEKREQGKWRKLNIIPKRIWKERYMSYWKERQRINGNISTMVEQFLPRFVADFSAGFSTCTSLCSKSGIQV